MLGAQPPRGNESHTMTRRINVEIRADFGGLYRLLQGLRELANAYEQLLLSGADAEVIQEIKRRIMNLPCPERAAR